MLHIESTTRSFGIIKRNSTFCSQVFEVVCKGLCVSMGVCSSFIALTSCVHMSLYVYPYFIGLLTFVFVFW